MLREAMRRVVLYRVAVLRDAERGRVGCRQAARLDAHLARLERVLRALRVDLEGAAIGGRDAPVPAGTFEVAAAMLVRELSGQERLAFDARRLGRRVARWAARLERLVGAGAAGAAAAGEAPVVSAGATQLAGRA